MELSAGISRAKRGFRDDFRLHLVAIASLIVAFLCLGTALLSVANLSRIAERWGESKHVTVYLTDKSQETDIAQLRLVLESLREVQSVDYVSAAQARTQFAEQANLGDLSSLPPDAFPASLELALRDGVSQDRINKIAERVQRFGFVEEVETYHDWFAEMGVLLNAGKSAAGLLAMLVVICVLAVISNTIRLAVASRRDEIEVLKLCGATDSFVRGPFIIEGAIQGLASASLALVLLTIGYFAIRGHLEATLSVLTGVRTVFLDPLTILALLLGAAVVGALGSAMSLRRYLTV